MQRLAIGGAFVALAFLTACVGELDQLPEGPSSASSCRYAETDEAAQHATEDYRNAQKTKANAATVEEYKRAKEAADERRQYAKDCEETARNWSDLLAQQQSARAAVSSAITAKAAVKWTWAEIAALIATIGVGIAAIWVTRRASDNEIAALKEEAVKAEARSNAELEEARAATGVTRQIGQAQSRCYPAISDVEFSFGGDEQTEMAILRRGQEIVDDPYLPKVFFTVKNHGQSPAKRVFWMPSVKYAIHNVENGTIRERQGPRHFPLPDAYKEKSWGEVISAGETRPFSADLHILLDADERAALHYPSDKGALQITLVISLHYEDVFDVVHGEDHAFSGGTCNHATPVTGRFKLVSAPVHTFETLEELHRRGVPLVKWGQGESQPK